MQFVAVFEKGFVRVSTEQLVAAFEKGFVGVPSEQLLAAFEEGFGGRLSAIRYPYAVFHLRSIHVSVKKEGNCCVVRIVTKEEDE